MENTLNQMLQKRMPGSGSLLIGGAIGIGMTAEAAVRGGADFLLALNAGRYRVMGAASLAALLPLSNANQFTDQFARREILDRVSVPVLFGASCFDPATSPEKLVQHACDVGYQGIANFPSAIHFDGRFRQVLEEAGLGFAREARMLELARRSGLLTFGYAKTRAEITRLIEADVAMICLNFGWNAGGVQSVAQSFTIAEAADRARRVFTSIQVGHLRRYVSSKADRSSILVICSVSAMRQAQMDMWVGLPWTVCHWSFLSPSGPRRSRPLGC